MTQTNSWLLQTPVLPVLVSPTTKAENKYINFYPSYRIIRTIQSLSSLTKSIQGTRYSSFQLLQPETMMSLGFPDWGDKRSQTKIKTSKPLFFLRFFFLSLKMKTCLSPDLSLCKTKTTRSPAFARGHWLACIHDVSNNSYFIVLHQTSQKCDRHSEVNKYKESYKGSLHMKQTLVYQANKDPPRASREWL